MKRISPVPSAKNLITQEGSSSGALASETTNITVDVKGNVDLKTGIETDPKIVKHIPESESQKPSEETQAGSTGPRITGSMVAIGHEDALTRIKNIHTIYLGNRFLIL